MRFFEWNIIIYIYSYPKKECKTNRQKIKRYENTKQALFVSAGTLWFAAFHRDQNVLYYFFFFSYSPSYIFREVLILGDWHMHKHIGPNNVIWFHRIGIVIVTVVVVLYQCYHISSNANKCSIAYNYFVAHFPILHLIVFQFQQYVRYIVWEKIPSSNSIYFSINIYNEYRRIYT